MAREHINEFIARNSGSVLRPGTGASGTVYYRDGDNLGDQAPVYSSETGSTTRSQPLTVGASGRVEGEAWLDRDSYYLSISGTGVETVNLPIESNPGASAPGAELAYEETTSTLGGATSTTDIPGLTFTLDGDGQTAIWVEAAGQVSNASAGLAQLWIRDEDNNVIAGATEAVGAGSWTSLRTAVRLVPSAGEHTYKASLGWFGGTLGLIAAASNKAWIRATVA